MSRSKIPQSLLSAIALALITIPGVWAQAPAVGGCTVFPADNIWNTPVDQLPVSPNSAAWVTTIGTTRGVHADFGAGLWDGGPIGIPYITVTGSQTKYPATFDYADESDPGPYAIPLNAPIEGGSQSTGDRHALAVDTTNCVLYELYYAFPQASSWTAGSGAVFNLLSHALRPAGWTSTDAAGLPVFAGLVRYDEVLSGEIRHAIRFTVPQTRRAYVWPARHYASSLTGTQYPPMGARFRLRASFDVSGYSAANQVILRAMKKYGIMLADNGSAWFISGAPDERWNNDDLSRLGAVKGSDFEAVDVSPLMIDPNSGQARQSSVPTVSVSPSSATVPVNGSQQFTATVTDLSSQLVDWSVNGVLAGNSTVGFVSSNGLYTAPAVPPAGGTVTVRATSSVSPATGGSATVTVTSPVPVLTSISPASGAQGTAVAVTLNGSNFQAGSTVSISGTGVTASAVSVVSAAKITATFTIAAGAAAGARSVTVTTGYGTTAAVAFTVTVPPPPKPTLSSVSPATARRGAAVAVTLTGTNFTAPAGVVVQGSGVTVSGVTVVSTTSIKATFTIARNATRSSRNVTVTTTAGASNSRTFTVF
jgi:hypothetical protein